LPGAARVADLHAGEILEIGQRLRGRVDVLVAEIEPVAEYLGVELLLELLVDRLADRPVDDAVHGVDALAVEDRKLDDVAIGPEAGQDPGAGHRHPDAALAQRAWRRQANRRQVVGRQAHRRPRGVVLLCRAMYSLLLTVVLGAVAAGFVQGLSGFAFGLVAMAFWVWAVPPQLAAPLVVFGSLVGQLLAVGSLRRVFALKRALPFILGGVIGVPLGAALLPHIDQTLFKAVIGALLAVWCPIMLAIRELPRIHHGGAVADGAVGLVGGVMGGLGGLTGPAPTLWCALRGWDKDAQRAVFQSFNLVMHALTLTVYATRGLITAEAAGLFVVVAPAMVIPAILGARLYARFSDAAFRRVVLLLLLISGVVLLVSSVPKLLF
jgi:uncharacterized protein